MRKSMLRTHLPALLAAAMVLVGTSAGSANEIPMTINGEINCAHPDNAITITCRGANPAPPGDANPPPPAPVPTVTPQLPTEAPPPGVTITYSGDVAINCALPENASNTICLPMTNPDGSINCQQADNAITTTCWERAQAMKEAGATATEIDCSVESFKNYPACTGIKPQAVIDQEQARATSGPPAPVVTPQLPTEAPPPGVTLTYSGDTAINCALPENASNTRCLPMTNPDGSINCQQADNAITTTCWERAQAMKEAGATATEIDCSLDRFKDYPACTGIKPQAVLDQEKAQATSGVPVPVVTPQLPTEAPPPGVALTYSGDTVLNCALPENAGNTRCLPMTNPDGSINCQQADNAITTTCWERGLAEKQAGPTVTPEVDCTLERFQGYPVCTGIKPEAVIVQEQASQATASTSEPVADPKLAETKIEVEPESNKNLASPAETQTQVAAATGGDSIDTEELPIAGTISLKSVTSKSTTINLELNLGSLAFRVIATKKGAPTITRDLTIDEDGQRTIKFARNLKGYTIRVLVDGEEIDRIRA